MTDSVQLFALVAVLIAASMWATHYVLTELFGAPDRRMTAGVAVVVAALALIFAFVVGHA